MTCDDVRDRLSARIDGALDPATETEIAGHLATCAACQRELAELERTVAGLHALGDVHAPAGFVDRVLARARPEPWTHKLFRAVFLPLPRKLPLQATAVVLVGILTVWLYRGTPELERVADQAVARHPERPVVAPPVSPSPPSTPRSPEALPAKEAPRPPATERQTRVGDRERPAERSRTTEEARASGERAGPERAAPPSAHALRRKAEPGEPAELGNQKAAAAPDVQPRAADSATGVAESTAQPGVASPSAPAASAPARARVEPAPPSERAAPPEVVPRANRADETRESAVLKSQQAAEPSGRSPVSAMRQTRAAPPAALTAALAPPLRGVLRVGDRTESERAMRDLFGRLGATVTWDRPEPSVITIEAPKSVLVELLDGLRALGELRIEPSAGELPDRVTLVLRLAS